MCFRYVYDDAVGDNNPVHDRGLYNVGQMWLTPEDILGRAVGYLPYVGMVTIKLTDYPLVKYALVAIMGLFVITAKEWLIKNEVSSKKNE